MRYSPAPAALKQFPQAPVAVVEAREIRGAPAFRHAALVIIVGNPEFRWELEVRLVQVFREGLDSREAAYVDSKSTRTLHPSAVAIWTNASSENLDTRPRSRS